MAAVLDLMAAGKVRCGALVSRRFPFDRVAEAYDHLMTTPQALGILLDYPETPSRARTLTFPPGTAAFLPGIANDPPGLALVGAGQYAFSTLLPALAKASAHRRVVVIARQGAAAAEAARRFGFQRASSDPETAFDTPEVDAVILTTRHDLHADQVARALEAGKHVFVEKPLAVDRAGLERVRRAMERHPGRSVTVGFNRRFAPMAVRLKRLLQDRHGPVHLLCEISAGALPTDHWLRGPEGGGRLVGEGCHFIDLMRFWAGSPIKGVQVLPLASGEPGDDAFTLTLAFQDGSLGTLVYTSQGNGGYPKETYTCHWEEKTVRLDNFRRLEGWGSGPAGSLRSWRQDKGHAALLSAWIANLGAGEPIAREELLEVAHWTLYAAELLHS
jgi:predicted dehydrogenase